MGLILGTNVFDKYVLGFELALSDPHLVIVGQLAAFAAVHSGLAYARPSGVRWSSTLWCLQHACAASRVAVVHAIPVLYTTPRCAVVLYSLHVFPKQFLRSTAACVSCVDCPCRSAQRPCFYAARCCVGKLAADHSNFRMYLRA